MIDCTMKRISTGSPSTIAFEIPNEWRPVYRQMLEAFESKTNGYYRVRIDRPFRPRTTGWKSQNHHLRGHEKQLAAGLGLTMSEVHSTIKEELADWPERIIKGPKGDKIIKMSESEISVEVCSAAIELCHMWAAHVGVMLVEEKDHAQD